VEYADSTKMYVRVLLLSLAVGLAAGTQDQMIRQINRVMKDKMKMECFGEANYIKYQRAVEGAIEKCLQLAPAFNLASLIADSPNTLKEPRRRRGRDTGLVNVDEDDFVEFLDDVADFKGGMAAKMGNLTCVLTEMKMLTPEQKVNIEEYTKDATEIEGFDLEASPLASDPEWWQRLVKGYQDCYDISESIPQPALNKNPRMKRFGRQISFFKCADKNEKMNCALGFMKQALELKYAADDRDLTEFDLPADKYEAAGLTLMVQENGAPPEENFVWNFVLGEMPTECDEMVLI